MLGKLDKFGNQSNTTLKNNKGKLNRSESGNSVLSGQQINSNQIDHNKIEKLLNMFNVISKNDNMMKIMMMVIKEVKSLILSSSVSLCVLTDDYSKYV